MYGEGGRRNVWLWHFFKRVTCHMGLWDCDKKKNIAEVLKPVTNRCDSYFWSCSTWMSRKNAHLDLSSLQRAKQQPFLLDNRDQANESVCKMILHISSRELQYSSKVVLNLFCVDSLWSALSIFCGTPTY